MSAPVSSLTQTVRATQPARTAPALRAGAYLHIDFETRSTVDLKKSNAYIYFDDPTTDLWCAAWAFGDDEPRVWLPGEPCPPEIAKHVEDGGLIAAWNAAFERLAWRQILGPRYGWPIPKLEQYRCVMAQAYAVGLPGSLDQAAAALGVDQQKDAQGYRLMMQMCRPRSIEPLVWWNDPEKLQRLAEYCRQDVKAEVACFNKLPALRAEEQRIWFLDQQINDRGVYIDKALCDAAAKVVAKTEARLDAEMRQITDMAVRKVSETSKLTAFIRAQGLPVESIAKDQVIELLARDDLSDKVRRVIEIRQEGSKTSTAKIHAMLMRRQADGRMRGNLQYHGAGPGRWAARGAQLQNLPRPNLDGKLIANSVIDDLMLADDAWIEVCYGPALSVVSDCIRSMIAAPKGRIIRAVDFSQIEARMIAWLAGEESKLDVFRRYDAKQGPDTYIAAAAKIFGVDISVIVKGDPRRQVGKVGELALGFEGGPGAFAKMAKTYNVDIGNVYDIVWESAPEMNRELAADAWDQRGKATGMSRRRWIAAELIKLAWRQAHPNVVQLWRDCGEAAIRAIDSPGTVAAAGAHLKYLRSGSWLFCRLPSGRAIAYAYPRVVWRNTPWGDKRPAVVYKGVDSFTKQWSDQDFYGGHGAHNATQGAARDVMAGAMLRAEEAGYECILTVHDELVTESPASQGSLSELTALSAAPPEWAPDLPVTVDGWEGPRYKK
jgi:DNA polymerase